MTVNLSVLVLPAFDDLPGIPGEATPWREAYDLTETVEIPGVAEPVRYSPDGLGIVPTGIGKTAAATTTTALVTSDTLNFSDALILSVGVAGGPPSLAIGSVVFATSIVDWDDKCRFDNDSSDSISLATNPYTEGQGAFKLVSQTVQNAVQLVEGIPLDSLENAHPANVPARPIITTGTNVCGDELWHGEELAEQVEWLVSQADIVGEPYRVTEMEDAGTAYALSQFGMLSQYVSIRGIANYDRPLGGATARDNFFSDSFESGFAVGLKNVVRAARAVVDYELRKKSV